MKGRLIALLGICIAILIVSGLDTQGKKPDNQGKPDKTQSECIAFDGALEGADLVKDFYVFPDIYPEYTMFLPFGVGDELAGTFIPAGTYAGHLFINYAHGTGRKEYIVHFWTDPPNDPNDYDFGIEIIGGVIVFDRKTEVLTVTFTDEVGFLCEGEDMKRDPPGTGVPTGECVDASGYDAWETFDVSFTLVRYPCDSLDDCQY